jgi:hypothetical protein
VNPEFFSVVPRSQATLAGLLVSAAFWSGASAAQPIPQTVPPVAAHAPTSFQSAMDGYKRFTDEKPVNWKAANETTSKIGGWRAYAKEAAEPSPAPAASPASAAKP